MQTLVENTHEILLNLGNLRQTSSSNALLVFILGLLAILSDTSPFVCLLLFMNPNQLYVLLHLERYFVGTSLPLPKLSRCPVW